LLLLTYLVILSLHFRLKKPDEAEIQHSASLTEILIPPSGKVFLQDLPDLRTSCAFHVDRKSDQNNLACGEIYRTQIARYKRRHRYGCLGTKYVSMDNKSIVAERYFSQSNLPTENAVFICPVKDFVDRRRGFHDKPSSTSCPTFIPLSTPGSDSGSGTCSQSCEGSVEDNRTRPVCRKRSVELDKLLTDNPHDIGSWLELVRCQNSEVSSDSLCHGSTPDKVSSAVSDIQAAILDRALEKNPLSIELKVAQLRVCHSRWDVEKVAAEWKKMVFQHAGDPQVWRQYLGYVRSSFRTFSSGRVVSAYIRAISTLRGARDRTLLSHKAPPRVTTHMIGKCCGCSHFILGHS